MRRYIDADKLKEMIEAKADTLIEGKQAFLYVAKWLDLLPTADVVEVVRCKDCVHSDKCELDTVPKEVLWCVKLHSLAHENHYCSYGERREG